MLDSPKNVAPEPYFSAALHVLYTVAVYVRLKTNQRASLQPDDLEEINALANATHNVPASIREYGVYFDEELIRLAFRDFDERGSSRGWIRLEQCLDEGIDRAKRAR